MGQHAGGQDLPLQCYRDAIKGLPEDLKQYGQAADDIARALQVATVDKSSGRRPTRHHLRSAPTETNWNDDDGDTDTHGDTETGGPETKETIVAVDNTDPGSPSSVPMPLIILGGLALLLLALGSAGYISRRAQARRGEPPTCGVDRKPLNRASARFRARYNEVVVGAGNSCKFRRNRECVGGSNGVREA